MFLAVCHGSSGVSAPVNSLTMRKWYGNKTALQHVSATNLTLHWGWIVHDCATLTLRFHFPLTMCICTIYIYVHIGYLLSRFSIILNFLACSRQEYQSHTIFLSDIHPLASHAIYPGFKSGKRANKISQNYWNCCWRSSQRNCYLVHHEQEVCLSGKEPKCSLTLNERDTKPTSSCSFEFLCVCFQGVTHSATQGLA